MEHISMMDKDDIDIRVISEILGAKKIVDFDKNRKETEKGLSDVLGFDISYLFQDVSYEKEKFSKSEYKVIIKQKIDLLEEVVSIIDELELELLDGTKNIDTRTLIDKLSKNIFQKLSYNDRARFILFIKLYFLKVRLIEYFINLGLPGKDLFKLLFDVDLKSDINYERVGPALVFYISNKEDFAKAYIYHNVGELKGKKKSKIFKKAKEIYGLKISDGSEFIGLNDSIVLVNTGKEDLARNSTLLHELQHVMNAMLGLTYFNRKKYNTITYFQKKDEILIKDELLAYLSEGFDVRHIFRILSNEKEEMYNRLLHIKAKHPKIYKYLWQQHINQLRTSIQIAEKFKRKYPINYINMLAILDIEHWGKFSKYL